MGSDDFRSVLLNLQHLREHRRHLAGPAGPGAIGLPWIVPRLMRCEVTYADINSFFDRWQLELGTAVLEGPPPGREPLDDLAPAVSPASAVRHQLRQRMTVLSDGRVPVDETDREGENAAGTIADETIEGLWQIVREQRAAAGEGAAPSREPGTWTP